MQIIKRILALLLCLAMLLSLCACSFSEELLSYFDADEDEISDSYRSDAVIFDHMEYTRPDISKMQELSDGIEESAPRLFKLGTTIELVSEFFDYYVEYTSMLTISQIRFDLDTSSDYWYDEYSYCSEASGDVRDMLNSVFLACSKSRWHNYFDSVLFGGLLYTNYVSTDGSGYTPDEKLTELLRKEAELENAYSLKYAEFCADESKDVYEKYNQALGEIYIELIKARKEIAELQNFDSYEELSYYSYGREYSPESLDEFISAIKEYIAPMYKKAKDNKLFKKAKLDIMGPNEALRVLRESLEGTDADIDEAMSFMCRLGLYDVGMSDTKYEQSYVTYLDKYDSPYLFFSPYGNESDILSLAHEFGHYIDNYVNFSSGADLDSSETFSQTLEYLICCCIDDTKLADALTNYKLLETITVYLNQAGLNEFEQKAFLLSDEELTVEDLNKLYGELAVEYGITEKFDEDISYEWISVPHIFSYPFYCISYCVSNTAAFSLYEKELNKSGAGISAYMSMIKSASEKQFNELISDAGLPSPTAPATVKTVSETLSEKLGI